MQLYSSPTRAFSASRAVLDGPRNLISKDGKTAVRIVESEETLQTVRKDLAELIRQELEDKGAPGAYEETAEEQFLAKTNAVVTEDADQIKVQWRVDPYSVQVVFDKPSGVVSADADGLAMDQFHNMNEADLAAAAQEEAALQQQSKKSDENDEDEDNEDDDQRNEDDYDNEPEEEEEQVLYEGKREASARAWGGVLSIVCVAIVDMGCAIRSVAAEGWCRAPHLAAVLVGARQPLVCRAAHQVRNEKWRMQNVEWCVAVGERMADVLDSGEDKPPVVFESLSEALQDRTYDLLDMVGVDDILG